MAHVVGCENCGTLYCTKGELLPMSLRRDKPEEVGIELISHTLFILVYFSYKKLFILLFVKIVCIFEMNFILVIFTKKIIS